MLHVAALHGMVLAMEAWCSAKTGARDQLENEYTKNAFRGIQRAGAVAATPP